MDSRAPIFQPVASDSGQDDIEALEDDNPFGDGDDVNLMAIQQEMLEAGYSRSEIRASL